MTSVGFTGTRGGMTTAQWESVHTILVGLFGGTGPHEWHDGDCVGADDQAHRTVAQINRIYRSDYTKIRLIGHPCNLDFFRAFNEDFDLTYEPKAPMVRNRDIVADSEIIVAGPKEYEELLRKSGTWATMREAVRRKRELTVVWPDGSIEKEYVPPSLRK